MKWFTLHIKDGYIHICFDQWFCLKSEINCLIYGSLTMQIKGPET